MMMMMMMVMMMMVMMNVADDKEDSLKYTNVCDICLTSLSSNVRKPRALDPLKDASSDEASSNRWI